MIITINGISVEKKDNKIKFVYKDVPVTVTVVPSIAYDDVVDLVVYECMEIDTALLDK